MSESDSDTSWTTQTPFESSEDTSSSSSPPSGEEDEEMSSGVTEESSTDGSSASDTEAAEVVDEQQQTPDERAAARRQSNDVTPIRHAQRRQRRGAARVLSSDEEMEVLDEREDEIPSKRLHTDTDEAAAAASTSHAADDDDGSSCTICFDKFTTSGEHRIVCLKCGHLYGKSCIERWIRTEKAGGGKCRKCPQCNMKANISDIRAIYTTGVIKAVDTTELEALRDSNKAFKSENDALRISMEQLKQRHRKEIDEANEKLRRAEERASGSHGGSVAGGGVVVCECDQTAARRKTVRLSTLQRMAISTVAGSRSMSTSGETLVVTCRIDNNLFSPFGLQTISKDGQQKVSFPVHKGKPSACSVSPFNADYVVSTGSDKEVVVTSVEAQNGVRYRNELPAEGWSCCFVSQNEVLVGLRNGRVLKVAIDRDDSPLVDITNGVGHRPIQYVAFVESVAIIVVASLQECAVYKPSGYLLHREHLGSMSSFCFDERSMTCLVMFPPRDATPTCTYALYRLDVEDLSCSLRPLAVFSSECRQQTRMIRCAHWTCSGTLFSAVFDESQSLLMILDWSKNVPVVASTRRVADRVVAVREIPTAEPSKFRIACLSETCIYFFEMCC